MGYYMLRRSMFSTAAGVFMEMCIFLVARTARPYYDGCGCWFANISGGLNGTRRSIGDGPPKSSGAIEFWARRLGTAWSLSWELLKIGYEGARTKKSVQELHSLEFLHEIRRWHVGIGLF
jgi:hypothetical protein